MKPKFEEKFPEICKNIKGKICSSADELEAKIPADAKASYELMKGSLCGPHHALVDEGQFGDALNKKIPMPKGLKAAITKVVIDQAMPVVEAKLGPIAQKLGDKANCQTLQGEAVAQIEQWLGNPDAKPQVPKVFGKFDVKKEALVRPCLVLAHYVLHDHAVMGGLLWLWLTLAGVCAGGVVR